MKESLLVIQHMLQIMSLLVSVTQTTEWGKQARQHRSAKSWSANTAAQLDYIQLSHQLCHSEDRSFLFHLKANNRTASSQNCWWWSIKPGSYVNTGQSLLRDTETVSCSFPQHRRGNSLCVYVSPCIWRTRTGVFQHHIQYNTLI